MVRKSPGKVGTAIGLGLLGALGWVASGAYATPSSTLNPSITVSATTWTPGALAVVNGGGFAPNADFAITFDQSAIDVASWARTTDGTQTSASGSFQAHVYLPPAPYGAHQICAATGSVSACTPVPIQPTIKLSPANGPPGMHFTATGDGFPSSEVIAIYIDSAATFLGTPGPQADFNGSFFQNLVWPSSSAAGLHQLCGDSGYPGSSQPVQVKVCTPFDVAALTPTLTVTPSEGPAGTVVEIRGSGFGPTNEVFVDIAGKQLANYMCGTVQGDLLGTDASGNFTMHVTIAPQTNFRYCPPIAVAYGPSEICSNTGTAHACATFTLTQGPPISAPSSPSPSTDATVSPTTLPTNAPNQTAGPRSSPPPSVGPAVPVAARQAATFIGLAVAAAVLVVCLAIGAGFWYWRRRRPRGI